jgi:predicted ATPase/DNA-binding winged helix-turn-helix (wHTH) protein
VSLVYDLGPFQLDVANRTLTRSGVSIPLGMHAVGVLATLVEHAPAVTPKAAILDAVWPNVIVEEGNLSTQVYLLRRALAQVSGADRWIQTLSGRGYRYVGPIAEHPADPRDALNRSNLCEPLTSFIGRERELVELKRLLPTRRLITIVGAGGIGKTRLALRVAAEVLDAYRDGVWLVELAVVRDPERVSASVAGALRLRESRGTSATQSLCRHFATRQALLLLDNCEHVIDACAQLAQAVLRDARDVAIIATAREPLRVQGEQVYALQPLSIPKHGSKLETASDCDAVQLFVERVQDHSPNLEFTPARMRTVSEICIRLDGIPLALELAAARAGSLSLEQISSRLDDRFSLLTTPWRTTASRQQTLRATLDWSYDLLTEHERLTLRRLSVFPSSFSIEAASAVVCDAEIDELAVVDLLSQLVSRSLVLVDTNKAAARYRLLETTRAYAQAKLVEAGESAVVARRHAGHFQEMFARATEHWHRISDLQLCETYLPELDQLRAALGWALGPQGDAHIAVALAGASGALWASFGLFSEGIRWLEAAIALIGRDTPGTDEALLLLQFGRLVDETPARSRAAFERACTIYRRIGDDLWLGITLARLGRVLGSMGRFEQAEAALTEAYPLLERSGEPAAVSVYYFYFAFLKSLMGDFESARRHYEQAIVIDREAGHEFDVLSAFGNLANVNWALGDLDAAEDAFRQQVALVRGSVLKTKRLLGWALTSLAGVLTTRGELDEALRLMREGLPLLLEDGSAWIWIDHAALRAAYAGNLAHAAQLAGYADQAWMAKEATRHPIEARAAAQLRALLRERLPAAEVERLRAQGAAMSDAAACRTALEG